MFISFLLLFPEKDLDCLNCSDDNKFSVLVITETKGFVHKSIDAGLDLVKLLGDDNKFNVYSSNSSDVITEENLKNISSVIFLNTTGDILNIDTAKSNGRFYRRRKRLCWNTLCN